MSQVIHVIDDDEAVGTSLAALLAIRGYNAQAHVSCREFLETFDQDESLCIIADLQMPEMGGLELQSHLLEKKIDLPFIVITGNGDVPSAVQALKSGAADFIEKPLDTGVLLSAVGKAVAKRKAELQAGQAAASAREKIDALTPRERDVLRHLVAGHANKIIAYELGISARTVENHRARLMAKMHAESVAELVKMALQAGEAPV